LAHDKRFVVQAPHGCVRVRPNLPPIAALTSHHRSGGVLTAHAKAGTHQPILSGNFDTNEAAFAFLLNGIVKKPPCMHAEWLIHLLFIAEKQRQVCGPLLLNSPGVALLCLSWQRGVWIEGPLGVPAGP